MAGKKGLKQKSEKKGSEQERKSPLYRHFKRALLNWFSLMAFKDSTIKLFLSFWFLD